MKTELWIDSDTKLVFNTELDAWKKYMSLNEKQKPCIIVINKANGEKELFSKLFLKSALCCTDRDVMKVVGSFLC